MGVGVGYHNKVQEGATDLTLTAGAGESILVTGIRIFTPLTAHVTLETDKTTVGYFRVSGTQGNHLFWPDHEAPEPNLLALLLALDVLAGYPIGEGQTFRITGAKQATSIQLVEYILADAGVYLPTQPNGSLAESYAYMNYGHLAGTAADGENLYTTSQTPAQFPDFPFGRVAPEGKRIRLFGICFSDVGISDTTQANQQETDYLKLIRERIVLFDEDRLGLFCLGIASGSADETNVAEGQSVLGNRSDADLTLPFLFDEPPVFEAGEELLIYLSTNLALGTANLLVADTEIGLILGVSPSGGGRF